jgi:hypothetical protein
MKHTHCFQFLVKLFRASLKEKQSTFAVSPASRDLKPGVTFRSIFSGHKKAR